MSDTMQHHHVTLIPREDKLAEARDLLLQCAKQVSLKKDENGPINWCASYDENKKHFFVDALFPNQEAVEFHQNNIQSIVKNFGELMAAPPETIVRSVFSIAP
jgi:quinol monooxygenase YgiN